MNLGIFYGLALGFFVALWEIVLWRLIFRKLALCWLVCVGRVLRPDKLLRLVVLAFGFFAHFFLSFVLIYPNFLSLNFHFMTYYLNILVIQIYLGVLNTITDSTFQPFQLFGQFFTLILLLSQFVSCFVKYFSAVGIVCFKLWHLVLFFLKFLHEWFQLFAAILMIMLDCPVFAALFFFWSRFERLIIKALFWLYFLNRWLLFWTGLGNVRFLNSHFISLDLYFVADDLFVNLFLVNIFLAWHIILI